MNLTIVSSGELYWPIDSKKISDPLDFDITKGILKNSCNTKSSLELFSNQWLLYFWLAGALAR